MSSCIFSAVIIGLFTVVAVIYVIQKAILNKREGGMLLGEPVDTRAMRKLDRRWQLLIVQPMGFVSFLMLGLILLNDVARGQFDEGWEAYAVSGGGAFCVASAVAIAVLWLRAYRNPKE